MDIADCRLQNLDIIFNILAHYLLKVNKKGKDNDSFKKYIFGLIAGINGVFADIQQRTLDACGKAI